MSILSGVSVPEDVLHAIFEETLPQDLASAFPYPHLSPLLLGQVCGCWRGLTHRNPSLWRLLSIEALMPYAEMHLAEVITTGLIQLQYWLNRCGEKGLCLRLDVDFYSTSLGIVIVENLSRFRALEIAYPLFKAIAGANSSVPLPLLHTFSIIGESWTYVELSPDIFGKWKGLPQSRTLRRLHVGVVGTTWTSLVRIPWAQLTHLSLAFHISSALLYDLLAACKSIEHCIVAVNVARTSTPRPPIAVPHLHLLDITFTHAGDIDGLRHIQLPSLRSFALRAFGTADELQNSLRALGTQPNVFFSQLRNVHDLTIHADRPLTISDEILMHILHFTPNLTTLTLSCPKNNYTSLMLALSNHGDDRNVVLPRLRTFALCLTFARFFPLKHILSADDLSRMAQLCSSRSSQAKIDDVLHVVNKPGDKQRKLEIAVSRACAEAIGGDADAAVPFLIVEHACNRCCTRNKGGSPWAATV